MKEQTVTPDKDGNWTYKFTDLPMYDQTNNQKYTYTVKEKDIPANYVFSADQVKMEKGVIKADIVNTYQPEGMLPETGGGMAKRVLLIVGASIVLVSLGSASIYWYRNKQI